MTTQRSPLELKTWHEQHGDALGWFETLYQERQNDADIPWMNFEAHPLLVEFVTKNAEAFQGTRVLMVGCGLGDDAEFVATGGAHITAFDISETAIARCQARFPDSTVTYEAANLLDLPKHYHHAFDWVIEIRTIQSMPKTLWKQAFLGVSYALNPESGHALSICNGRLPQQPEGMLPLPLLESELREGYAQAGLENIHITEHFINERRLFQTVASKPKNPW
jgi:SAM-dependent methyltransferase